MTSEAEQRPVSGARQRSRRAILDATVAVWARDFSASLGDIADRAGVSRSTLHRNFPDRQALVDAALLHAIELLDRESRAATAGTRNAAEELEALMRVLIDASDALIFLFSEPNRFSGNENWDQGEDEELPDTVSRAQAEGALAPDLDPRWIVDMFYSTCYVAAEAIASGKLSRHRAAQTAIRTFLHGVGPAS